MKVIDIKENDSSAVYPIYSNGSDVIEAVFSGWNGKHEITEITITKSYTNEIGHVNYCSKTNAIEIHYYKSNNSPFKEVSFELNSCKLNCLRVLILVYDKDEKITECSSTQTTAVHPKHKKGNIIVGNP